MNRERRRKLTLIAGQLDALKEEVEALRDAEQEAFDNMPENLQQGDKGSAGEQAVSDLQDLLDHVEAAAEAAGSFSDGR